jgi:GntR family transcriptional regulator
MPEPKFVRVIDEIIRQITVGELKPRQWLPTVGELCETFQCSAGTIRGAFLTLKALGWVVGAQGKGVHVADQPGRPVRRTP